MSKNPVIEEPQPYPAAEHDYVRPIPLDPDSPDAYQAYGELPPRRGGAGCWIVGLATLFTVVILIGVGLLLPPFNLLDRIIGAQYAILSADANAVAADGITVYVDPAAPGENFGVALSSIPMQSFMSASPDVADWVPRAYAAQPPDAALQSPVYTIRTTGDAPPTVMLSIEAPETSSPDVLDVYAWDETRAQWVFLPSHAGADGIITAVTQQLPQRVALFQAAPMDQPRVLASVDVTQYLTPEVAQLATIIAPAGLQPTLEGTLAGSLAPGFELNAGYLVMPVIRNYIDARAVDPETVTAILSNRLLRAAHAAQIAGFAASGYDGVLIDYRDVPEDQRDNFTALIEEVGQLTDAAGVALGVVVPGASVIDGAWHTGAYDWRAIGRAVDVVQINLPIDPFAYSPGTDRLVEAMTRWAVGEIERDKILLGLSAQSVRQTDSTYTAIPFDDAFAALGDVQVRAQTTSAGTVNPGDLIYASLDGYAAAFGSDPTTGQIYIDYADEQNNPVARMWLLTPDALRYRMERGTPFAVGGVAFEDLLSAGLADGIYQTILDYKLSAPVQVGPSELALRWTVEGSNGTILEAFTQLNDDYIATIEAPDGNYAINVEVVSDDGASAARGGAAVAVFAPTATPTPLPTATPTPTPAPTNTPNRAAAVANPSGSGSAAAAQAVRPASGSIVAGQFEYGGHVTGTGTGAAGAMQRAGMNWMKIQLRYSPGMGADAAAGPIAEAHGRGFKILVGVVGNPGDLAAGGAGYVSQFASFLGGVAGYGPDAIEVWNEPNIDREWPRDQISASAYTEMLRQAYTAIKSVNSGVMVISAAPAPTGAEAAFPGQVVNDDRYIREMVAAGAVNYMDCLGAHYNEGVVAPSATGGDPRDNYYTRYFGSMLDTYWNAVGGQRPICFTELGYLTPEGYPPLDPYFAWGANTTVAQQSAWLAEAAALASQSGRVRLMIVWNVDFSNYGADPMAGFAIIRPGGACPACDALAGAR
jgi:hypothetical protein